MCACHERKFGKRCVGEISRQAATAFKMAVISPPRQHGKRSYSRASHRGIGAGEGREWWKEEEEVAAPYLGGLLSCFTQFHTLVSLSRRALLGLIL